MVEELYVRVGPGPNNVKVVLSLAIALLALVGFLFSGLAQVLSDHFIQTSPDGVFQYAVKHRDGASAEIEVMFDLDDPAALARYLQANEVRAETLLNSAQGERLWTTITFARPLAVEELQALLQDTAIEPVSYTLVGWTRTGQRMGSTIFADSPDAAFDLEGAVQAVLPTHPEAPDYGAQIAGLMVVDGYILISDQGLGKLMADERVLLVDTTAYEAQKLAGMGRASVHLPTPFWNMDWRTAGY